MAINQLKDSSSYQILKVPKEIFQSLKLALNSLIIGITKIISTSSRALVNVYY